VVSQPRKEHLMATKKPKVKAKPKTKPAAKKK
jgi:hypothetical protein